MAFLAPTLIACFSNYEDAINNNEVIYKSGIIHVEMT